MNKYIKITLIVTKYLFITFIVFFTVLLIGLTIYSKNLDYYMPEIVNIEIYDKDKNLIDKINNASSTSYVRIDDISKNIIDAFISIEDKEFYNHQGINFKRIIGAMLKNIKTGSIAEGGSTITQQYVKNTFLDSSKTFKRKLEEALISINLESKYSKEEILEGYLNTIYFDHGITGIYDACQFYFNKYPYEITLNEACVLAAIPKSPSNYSPIKNPENNNNRRKLILSELYKDSFIDEDTYNLLIEEIPEIYGKLEKVEIENSPYYLDIIIKELKNLNIDLNKEIKVYTTLDSNLNKIIANAIDKYYVSDDGIELGIVAMDTNGNVLANVGGVNYVNSTYNRTFSLRQPGSTIKTFLYYTALKNGFNVSSKFTSEPTTFYYNNKEYTPSNYKDIYPNQEVSMIYAIACSDNIYAMKTHLYLGTSKLYNTLLDFGFNKNIKNNPSLALGTSEVTLNELTTGYAKIASLGKDISQTYITKVTDFNGTVIYQCTYNNNNKYDEKTCYLLSEALTNVFDQNIKVNISPTCSSINQFLTSKYACKSGSTDYDGLIVGYNKNIVLGIWSGYDDNRKIKNTETKYIKYIWAYIMENYNKNKNNSWYEPIEDTIAIRLNPINGELALFDEYQKYLYFDINNLPDYFYN